jgi:glycosyltransferase involved in cell wall biosynthesis
MKNELSIDVLIITNIPSPYRVLQFNRLAEILKGNFCVIYFQKTEVNRKWDIPKIEHRAIFLKQNPFSVISIYPDIVRNIIKANPRLIIASGFSLTILLAFFYSCLTKKKFIVLTDTWLHPVRNLTIFHRIVRHIVIPRADSSICVGIKSKEFLVKYGAKENSVFISPLAIRNELYSRYSQPFEDKEFDIIFSGQFIERKMPFFVLDVVRKLKIKKNNVSILIIGSGPLGKKIIKQLEDYKITYFFPGFIQQDDLPKFYSKAKILVFPTKDDPWGLVANEACAVGTPVITCEYAGVANDLIINDYNGFVLPLDVDVWVEHIWRLLSDIELYNSFSNNSLKQIKHFSIEKSARGIEKAINYLLDNEKS